MKHNLFTEGLYSNQGLIGVQFSNRSSRSNARDFRFTSINYIGVQTAMRLVNSKTYAILKNTPIPGFDLLIWIEEAKSLLLEAEF